ncbi:MAG: PmoA family protein [Victivallales bacterium]|nr:PmoA family protein [Victivallales bacterium]
MTKILVKAGNHNRKSCLVTAALAKALPAKKAVHLENAKGEKLPCQIIDGGKALLFYLPKLDAGKEATYEVKPGAVKCDEISVAKGKEAKSFDIFAGKELFATLHCGKQWAKPFIWPVYTPANASVTRAFPMMKNVPGETDDHVHQKSLWTGWGEVNGCDLWAELDKHGYMRVQKVDMLEAGPIRARFRLTIDWVDCKEKKLLSEVRELSFCATADARSIDFDVKVTATEGDVYFGDTKEGGICAVRVASSMDGVQGGVITLADGSVGEAESWGKRACWCDYYGAVEKGKAGICIMDNPVNDSFPTSWHVRDYGLMAANPYGQQYFTGNPAKNASFVIQAGASKQWKYRVLVHDTTLATTRMPERYQDYAHAPIATEI